MPTADHPPSNVWPLWQRVLFRFSFVYLLLQMAPWTWFDVIPGVGFVTQFYGALTDWAVPFVNAHVFHVRETLIPVNGSGDTSFAWAQLWLFLSVAGISCVLWSILDRKRANYVPLSYWLRTFVRYYIATFALSYGIIKLFALQMLFPTVSQLSTPLGDLLPMRLSWLFIGYSTPYQIFCGAMETIPVFAADSLRWRDLIIDNARGGSVGTTDSLYVQLVRSPRHFQLAERQFHWLSEYNR